MSDNNNIDSAAVAAADDRMKQQQQERPKASVKVTYILPDKTIEIKKFNASNTTTKRIGLPPDQIKPIKVCAQIMHVV